MERQLSGKLNQGEKKNLTKLSTSIDLYHQIAKYDFKQIQFPNENITIDESIIETLVQHHKSEFKSNEWQKICWFEHHFSKSVNYVSREYEEIVSPKYTVTCNSHRM